VLRKAGNGVITRIAAKTHLRAKFSLTRNNLVSFRLMVASIVLWNTVYLERAIAAIRQTGQAISDEALAHLSPLKWEHINLTGDYHWRKDAGLRNGKLRPLRAGVTP
jgi:hypothetical protein